jgi:ABC-2 type transport system permease protein
VVAVPRIYFNPALKSLNFIAPGMISVILMAFPPLLSALAIVREKERGSIQQIFVSPLRPSAFIIGKLIPYGGIAYAELVLVLLVTRYWFGAPMAGSVWVYLLVAIPYVFSAVAIGLLVSTLTSSQLAAMLLAIVLTMMPSFLFSGFMIPIFTMPEVIQAYSYAFPARFFVDITSQIYLRGARFAAWWQPLSMLILYTVGMVAIAALRFRKKVG